MSEFTTLPTKSANAIAIRPAKVADEMVIARLWAQLMAEMIALDDRQPHPVPGADRLYAGRLIQTLANERTADQTCVFVAEDKPNRVIGYVLAALTGSSDLFLASPSGFIVDLYVDRRVRRSGIGRRLVTSATGWLQARGVTSLALNVDSANLAGQAFWKSLGGADRQIRMHIDLSEDLSEHISNQQGTRA